MNTRKFHLPGEAALLIVLLINPLAIDLMSKSVFGISTISSVPLILSTAFPVFSFGTWNYIFQTLLVITLMVLKRSFCPGYLFSFVVGIGTFFCAFMTGRTVSLVQKFIGNHVEFYRLTKIRNPHSAGRGVFSALEEMTGRKFYGIVKQNLSEKGEIQNDQ